ncbi:hypothetical protein C8J56DRAFT_1054291 [Mycena floridula]|nr:hypothetical protein C8J56DRAFT_1054291 [Mycena floridula]
MAQDNIHFSLLTSRWDHLVSTTTFDVPAGKVSLTIRPDGVHFHLSPAAASDTRDITIQTESPEPVSMTIPSELTQPEQHASQSQTQPDSQYNRHLELGLLAAGYHEGDNGWNRDVATLAEDEESQVVLESQTQPDSQYERDSELAFLAAGYRKVDNGWYKTTESDQEEPATVLKRCSSGSSLYDDSDSASSIKRQRLK